SASTRLSSHLARPCLPLHSSQAVRLSFLSSGPPTTDIYTLSLHDALPICRGVAVVPGHGGLRRAGPGRVAGPDRRRARRRCVRRSEEHTSELQSRENLVCRLLLEKKKKEIKTAIRQRKITKDRQSRHLQSS